MRERLNPIRRFSTKAKKRYNNFRKYIFNAYLRRVDDVPGTEELAAVDDLGSLC